ncbi:transposase [Paenibacillus periandrae]|uniref:transposase n=1 Tax=Paenibacillus periandrae TaxID=1761741 RepID=UPI001F09FF9B|nr:transposase [Paenibacillus periandrae]
MAFAIGAAVIVIPIFMFSAAKWNRGNGVGLGFDWLAIVSGWVFAIMAAVKIYEINRDQEVMMTTIHKLFADLRFLACGAYLGSYLLYRLIAVAWESYQEMKLRRS